MVPPAWEEVRISPDPSGHILATGFDRAGRKQYIYHPLWEQVRDEAKLERMGEFGRRLTRLRRRMDSDLRRPGLSRDKVTALAVSVLDRTLIRVGNRRYADENDAYGLTTLTCEHVEVDGFHVHLEFAGKGGADHQLVFQDRRLSSLIARCQELSGQTLFGYETEQGMSPITSTDVNDYLAGVMSGPFTAKEFRTWGASTAVAEDLATGAGDGDQRLGCCAPSTQRPRSWGTHGRCAAAPTFTHSSLRRFGTGRWRRRGPGPVAACGWDGRSRR